MWQVKVVAVLSILSSIIASSIVDFRNVPNINIQPQNTAFSIWGIIFPSILLSTLIYGTKDVFPTESLWSMTSALAMTVGWAVALRARLWWLGFGFLLATASFNWIAAGLSPFYVKDPNSWFVQMSISLFAGWTTAATVLNLGIADRQFDNPKILTIAGVCIAALSIATKRPLPCIAYVWALAFQKQQSVWIVLALVSTIIGGILSYVRLIRWWQHHDKSIGKCRFQRDMFVMRKIFVGL